jgi:hypothetical protein
MGAEPRKAGFHSEAREAVAALLARARAAQAAYERSSQETLDETALAVGWAIMRPQNNRALAETAVRDTGLGNVEDKVAKNHRKTLGLLRDLKSVRTTGVIAEYPERGVTEIARAVGVVAAITPSTNPGATPANQIINALKCGNAVILAPSPKGYSTCALLLEFIYEEFGKIGANRDLVQVLPAPVTKEATHELMRQCDLVAATGSQANIRAGDRRRARQRGVDRRRERRPGGRRGEDRALEDLRQRDQLLFRELGRYLRACVRGDALRDGEAGRRPPEFRRKGQAAGGNVPGRQALCRHHRAVGRTHRRPCRSFP